MRVEKKEGEGAAKNPMRGTFPRCCASARETVARRILASKQVTIFLLKGFPSP
jgi:hypothetical protein